MASTLIHQSRPIKPYEVTETIRCEACGGTGFDMSTRDDFYPCEECDGKGEFEFTHDLLKEAFHIATGRASELPEIRHIQTLITHFREIVSALIEEPRPSPESLAHARQLVGALTGFVPARQPVRAETLVSTQSELQEVL